MFEKVIVVDARGHLLGRLASTVAKQLLCGQHVVVTRCESIDVSGSLIRNKLIYAAFRRKRMNTQPKRGPIHYRAPSKILWRTIRGMLPHKTAKGTAALERLKVFDGVPAPYDKMRRMVVPAALTVTRLRPGRKFISLGTLSSEVGWKYETLVERLEDKRKVKAGAYWNEKKAKSLLRDKAAKGAQGQYKDAAKTLAELGY